MRGVACGLERMKPDAIPEIRTRPSVSRSRIGRPSSFLEVAVLNGWGGYILTQANYVNAFFSHDEYIGFFAMLDENLAEVRKEFGTTEH